MACFDYSYLGQCFPHSQMSKYSPVYRTFIYTNKQAPFRILENCLKFCMPCGISGFLSHFKLRIKQFFHIKPVHDLAFVCGRRLWNITCLKLGFQRGFLYSIKLSLRKYINILRTVLWRLRLLVDVYSPPNEVNHSQIATVSITKVYSIGISYIA